MLDNFSGKFRNVFSKKFFNFLENHEELFYKIQGTFFVGRYLFNFVKKKL